MAKKERLTKFVILDFSAVTGVDATTARTLFATLGQLLKSLKIKLLVTDVDDRIRKLLEGHDLFNESIGCLQFATLDDGTAASQTTLHAGLVLGLFPGKKHFPPSVFGFSQIHLRVLLASRCSMTVQHLFFGGDQCLTCLF